MNDPSRRPDPESLLRAAAADLPENRPEHLEALGRAFPELAIEAAIGRGGSGIVYRVRQARLNRLAALKILDPALAAREPTFAERLQREGQALAQLDHHGILRVHDFGERDGRYYLLTEYVDGVDLRRLLALGELQPAEALRLVPQICAALQYAHDHGVVHRDVKPENILVDLDGNVKVADFGLARLVGPGPGGAHLTRDSQVLGTPHYMAPEQWRGAAVDHRADIFALGVVLYELLTGQLPVGDFAPPSQRPGVPRRLDQVVRKALAQDPGLRYQQAADLSADVRAVPTTPTAPSGAAPARTPGPTARVPLLLGLGIAALLVVGALWVVHRVMEMQRNAAWFQAREAHELQRAAAARDGAPDPGPLVVAGQAAPDMLLVGVLAPLLLILAVRLGFASIGRIRRRGGAADGLWLAELLAWGVFVGAFDAAVLVPIAQTNGPWEGLAFAAALLVLVPLNVVFFVWRYRCDRTAIGKVTAA